MQSRLLSLKYPHGHPCVAFLPFRGSGRETPIFGLPQRIEYVRRPYSKVPDRSRTPPTTGCCVARGSFPDHYELGTQRNHPTCCLVPGHHRIPRLQPIVPKDPSRTTPRKTTFAWFVARRHGGKVGDRSKHVARMGVRRASSFPKEAGTDRKGCVVAKGCCLYTPIWCYSGCKATAPTKNTPG